MRRLVDHVLCSLPFEETWFKERGCNATFVGHPYFDEVRQQQLDQEFLARMQCDKRPLVTILPGSRTQEVTQNLEWFLRAAAVVKARVSNVRFAVAAYKPHQAQFARERIKDTGLEIEVLRPQDARADSSRRMLHGGFGLGVAGIALSEEADGDSLFDQPVRLFHAGQVSAGEIHHAGESALGERYLCRARPSQDRRRAAERQRDAAPRARSNGDRVLFPEFLTSEDKSLEIAAHVIRWLVVEETREGLVAELAKLKARIGHGGASRIAADYILGELAKRPSRTPRPHFLPGMAVASSGGAAASRRQCCLTVAIGGGAALPVTHGPRAIAGIGSRFDRATRMSASGRRLSSNVCYRWTDQPF